MNAPPGNEKGAYTSAPFHPKLHQLKVTPSFNEMQSWEREAARLLREFWRTGNVKHLRAFVNHVAGMRQRLVGAAR